MDINDITTFVSDAARNMKKCNVAVEIKIKTCCFFSESDKGMVETLCRWISRTNDVEIIASFFDGNWTFNLFKRVH
jgi:hypothetical protein